MKKYVEMHGNTTRDWIAFVCFSNHAKLGTLSGQRWSKIHTIWMCLAPWSWFQALSCKSGEPWTLPKPEAMAMFLRKAGIQNPHKLVHSRLGFFASLCVCVCSTYATVQVWHLSGNRQGKLQIKKWMRCTAIQLKCNAIRSAKQCAYAGCSVCPYQIGFPSPAT